MSSWQLKLTRTHSYLPSSLHCCICFWKAHLNGSSPAMSPCRAVVRSPEVGGSSDHHRFCALGQLLAVSFLFLILFSVNMMKIISPSLGCWEQNLTFHTYLFEYLLLLIPSSSTQMRSQSTEKLGIFIFPKVSNVYLTELAFKPCVTPELLNWLEWTTYSFQKDRLWTIFIWAGMDSGGCLLKTLAPQLSEVQQREQAS